MEQRATSSGPQPESPIGRWAVALLVEFASPRVQQSAPQRHAMRQITCCQSIWSLLEKPAYGIDLIAHIGKPHRAIRRISPSQIFFGRDAQRRTGHVNLGHRLQDA
ncbi:MAG: hypothetical protein CRU78_04615 [Candidatus Accumulibacter phosphatis]|uniref:Uncharacterized protein n=1 Tax=Candidatus Accumulibacter phosphatis TaxID=327160 RepID=A0A6A7RRB4_9PROT|nr:hypothetical protein [Candidatus Accumulibacter phosphatis]